MLRKKGLFTDILVIIAGLFILLIGIWLVSLVVSGITATIVNIIPLIIAILFVSEKLQVKKYVGQQTVTIFYFYIILLALFCIVFSNYFVFDVFYQSNGDYNRHDEEDWFYGNMVTIANFSPTDWANGALKDLYLGKYQNLTVYASLLVRFGGNNPINMCIWNAFHLALVGVLILLIAVKLGIENRKQLIFIFLVGIMQPYLAMLFGLHRDGFGEAVMLLGIYIFISTYKLPLASLVAFPVYATLLWMFRAQYLYIAVALYSWSLFYTKKNAMYTVMGLIVSFIIVLYGVLTINIYELLYSELYMGGYENASLMGGRNFFNKLMVSIIGYFPWTNMFKDTLWTGGLFACFQGAINVAILYHVIRSNHNRMAAFIENPLLFVSIFFMGSAFFLAGHMSYAVVCMPLLATGIKNVTIRQFLKTYIIMIMVVFTAGLLYSMLGLAGTGAFK